MVPIGSGAKRMMEMKPAMTERTSPPAEQRKPGFGSPALDGQKTRLAALSPLMSKAREREQKSVSNVGWGVGGSSMKSVPTEAAKESHERAMELARLILSESEDIIELDMLRTAMQSDPMRDARDIKFRDCSPPFVDEINAKLARLMQK